MTEAIGAQSSVKKSPINNKYVKRGAIIGAAAGAVSRFAMIKSQAPKILTEDQYIKSSLDNYKKTSPEATEEAIEFFKNRLTEGGYYKDYVKKMEETLSAIKKATPKAVACSAFATAAIGVVIGGIVYLVKKSKANKAQETQQQ